MKRVLRTAVFTILTLAITASARAQISNFSADVNTAIDMGLAWLDTSGYFNAGVAGDASGLVALALLEKRVDANQNAVSQGYANASAADKARINSVIGYIIANSGSSFYAYRNGQEMMALALYVRTGGPLPGALAALNTAYDESVNQVNCIPDGWGGCAAGPGPPTQAQINAWNGYWCYTNVSCPDSSTTQFVASGLAAVRGVYGDPAFSDPGRLSTLNAITARTAAAYEANGGLGEGCSPGGVLTATERGHGYNAGSCNSFQQTGAGTWIQIVGGKNLNSTGVQNYLEWLRNRYRYVDINPNEWSGLSYGYGLWSASKALSFLDDSGATPNAGNLSSANLGTLPAADPPPYGFRQVHVDPTTAARNPLYGVGGTGYYNSPLEPARWYFDFAHTLLMRQVAGGYFSKPNGYWNEPSEQAYHILILARSVGGGCVDSDGDGKCDSEDNCPAVANPGQADSDSDGVGDVCDNCPNVPNANQADANSNGIGDACESVCTDPDGDGVCGNADNCPTTANAGQTDTDSDGLGDACDACPLDAANDADGDGVCGNVDNCPTTANSNQANADGDGLGDACDACPLDAANDADGDGVCGNVDNCPTTANSNQANADGDGLGDACDACPLDAANDADGDGVCGNVDNCPTVANSNQTDTDGNGVGDACTTGGNAAGGAFVVGNLANLAGNAIVNFWGSQWSQNNPMTGGSGPNAFKGFETSLAVPACGSTWTTSPGNSSNPPATVPAFLTIIVSSNVTQSGSTISGNVKKVLIVQTQPGYQGNPGHPGFGRVVAVVCSIP